MATVKQSEKLTPAMRQYMDVKASNKDAIIFFRMGDFYEMFFEDAEIASKVLGIALTSRDKNKEIPMCGIPYHSSKTYIGRLIDAGHKVAVCEQITDPKESKGIVERAVVEVITPGVKVADDLLKTSENNFIASYIINGDKIGFSFMDVSTGEFKTAEFHSVEELIEDVAKINPAEVLISESSPKLNYPGLNYTILDDNHFSLSSSKTRLTGHFQVNTLDGFGLESFEEGLKAAGGLLKYVSDNRKTELTHIQTIKPYSNSDFLSIDSSSMINLELLRNNTTKEKQGSLLGVMDLTDTAMGARLIRNWLVAPLTNVSDINKRLSAVESLVTENDDRRDLSTYLASIADIERLIGRVAMGTASPRDLVQLKESLQRIPSIKTILKGHDKGLINDIFNSMDEVTEVVEIIDKSIKEIPPATLKDGGFIREGYNRELDEIRELGSTGKDFLAKLEAEEKEKTGISTLKVRYNKIFGYYIEVSKLDSKKVPYEYTRKQTLVNAERYITPELKDWETKILTAEEKTISLEHELYKEVITSLGGFIERVQSSADSLAVLDSLVSFAKVASEYGYIRPEVNEGEEIIIKQGRHPVIEAMVREDFIPNDLHLDSGENQIAILTGPNMAGKSTYIRQVALIVLMAQAGSFVPAESAKIGAVDKIFTRVGASDDLTKGHSTFMVEMNETANILNNATSKSLIILDEIGRGTSTFDGLSIAWSVVEYLHDNKGVQAKTLFATHYHELTDITLTKERVKNYNMAVNEYKDDIIFLRKVVPGGASRSYGIQVARLAGIPDGVIDRAKEILSNLEAGEFSSKGEPKLAKKNSEKTKDSSKQLNLGLGIQKSAVEEELSKIDTNNITPVEALNILNKLKEKASKDG